MRQFFSRRRFGKKPFVLVVGSAHMDVFGDFPKSEKNRIDKEGEVFCSIGGSGFNIAVDLANEGGVSVALFTHVRARSPITDIIFARLRDEGVETRYVVRDSTIQRDSGFIAHRADSELISAVSSMPVEDAVFNEERLGRAIRKARVVIAECNLSGNQLALTSRLCAMKNTPLIVGGVSESKCKRIKLADSPIACFSLNTKEAKALVGDKPVPSAADYGVTICGIARSKYVVVTESSKGWTVYAADGTPQAFEAPKVGAIRSTSGAGDAIIAAIGHHLATEGSFEWAAIKATIHRFVDDVLRKRVASGADLTSIETLGAAYKGLLDQFKRPPVRISAALSAVVSLLVLIAAFISAAVDLEQSNTVFSRLNQAYCWLLPNSTACERNETEDARR